MNEVAENKDSVSNSVTLQEPIIQMFEIKVEPGIYKLAFDLKDYAWVVGERIKFVD